MQHGRFRQLLAFLLAGRTRYDAVPPRAHAPISLPPRRPMPYITMTFLFLIATRASTLPQAIAASAGSRDAPLPRPTRPRRHYRGLTLSFSLRKIPTWPSRTLSMRISRQSYFVERTTPRLIRRERHYAYRISPLLRDIRLSPAEYS